MTKTNLVRVILCVLVFGILIASGFLNFSQQPTGGGAPKLSSSHTTPPKRRGPKGATTMLPMGASLPWGTR